MSDSEINPKSLLQRARTTDDPAEAREIREDAIAWLSDNFDASSEDRELMSRVAVVADNRLGLLEDYEREREFGAEGEWWNKRSGRTADEDEQGDSGE